MNEVLRVHQDVVLWFRSYLTSSRRVGMFADRGCGSTFASGDAEPIVDVHGASSAWSSGSARPLEHTRLHYPLRLSGAALQRLSPRVRAPLRSYRERPFAQFNTDL